MNRAVPLPASPPAVDPALLRPRRAWYAVAVAIAVLSILIGGGAAFWFLRPVLTSDPGLHSRFEPGRRVVVRLDPGDHPAIYAAGASGPRARCAVSSARGGAVPVSPATQKYREDVGTTTWTWTHTINVTAPGEYRVLCEGAASAYAIGDARRPGEAADVLWRVVVAVGGCWAGLGIAGGIGLVTSRRRTAHRKRYQEARASGS